MRRNLLFFIVVLLFAGAATVSPSFSAGVGADSGSVSITSSPQGAAITVDGTSVGTTPLMGLPLDAGVHTVTASLTGYQQATQDFTLSAGEDKAINLNLAPVAPTISFATTVPITLPPTEPITMPTTEPVTIPTTPPITEPTTGPVTITIPTTPIGGGKGWITTHCNVNGAMVTFDNQRAGCTVSGGQCTVEVTVTGTPFRTFTVQAPGYQTFNGQVSNWPTEGQTVDLYADLTPIPPQSGAISAATSPSGAAISLNGNFQGYSPITIPDLAPGTYTILARLDGYTPVSQYVTVNNGQTSYFSASLSRSPQPQRDTGDVSVLSTPGGAQIIVDGGYRGVTPMTVTLYPGSHNILLQKSGFVDWTNTVYVTANSFQTVSATLVSGTYPGWVTIQASPPTVNVYFDQAYKGQTDSKGSFVIQGVAPGTHSLRLSQSGYNDYTTSVTVYSNTQTYISAVLSPQGSAPTPTPVPGYGTLAVSSTPAGASIYVDNAYMGYTPATLNPVASGRHTVMLALDGYQNYVTNVNVVTGGSVQVTSSLSPIATPTKSGADTTVLAAGAGILASLAFIRRRGL
ncbi:MAG TPA: PEGA domain-containing protein [Methanoregulaceae archaeon]|nr:PEGA domain-containing protein [Methanoregulaceae archaeon]